MTEGNSTPPPGGPQPQWSAPAQEQYAVRPQASQWEPGQVQVPAGPVVVPKNPAVSVLVSVFVPGLGSMLNDNVGIGVLILVLNILGWILSVVLIGIPLAIGTWIWGLVDAHQSAQRWNRAHGFIT